MNMNLTNSSDGRKNLRYIPAAFLIVVSLAIFWQALGHDFLVNWDDQMYVFENPSIRGLTLQNIKTAFTESFFGNYAPLHLISYMVDYDLWGIKASGFIFMNILLHIVSGLLFYLLILRISGEELPAFFASLLFLLHPVQVESVVWVSQRKTVLAMVLFLLALLWYVAYKMNKEERPARSMMFYGLTLAAFVLACLTKSVVVVFPLVLLLYDICFDKQKNLRSLLVDKIPFVVVSAVVSNLAIGSHSAQAVGGITAYHGGTLYATFLTMVPVLATYLRLVIWPANLSAVYSPAVKTSIDTDVVIAGTICIALIAVGVLLFRKRRDLFFWFLLFFIGLIPVSQIVPLVTLMNDRYLYFPMLGASAFLVLLIFRGITWSSLVTNKYVIPIYALCLMVVAAYAVVTFQRIEVWKNSATLWGDAVQKTPNDPLTHDGYGEGLLTLGRVDEALAQFKIALNLTPDATFKNLSPGARHAYANTFNNMGTAYGIKGQYDDAIDMFQSAILLKPDMGNAYFNLGNALMHKGRISEALIHFDAAARINPDNPAFLVNRENTRRLLHAAQEQEKK